MSLIDDFLNDDVSAQDIAVNTQAGIYGSPAPMVSGSLQSSLLGIGTSFLSGLASVELLKRSAQVQPQIVSRQAPLYADSADVTTRAAAQLGSVRLGNLLPFIVLGGVAYLVLKGR
ncbi:hypothetical protein EYS42_08785 [Aquabacterium lacunae]|uniref:Uncharacterized protein n=1 Tax=Aquabacterium lacunae TaxID=2528630 RepID=A0A4Q9GZ95_9BURK|nr:hypothetical protein [Aquabacterium lacunae]TBO31330.1 hypothetical protein EYS42_08785 [Aquabacterium lacunae]